MDTDSWGEIINGPNTFEEVARELHQGRTVALGWTDGRCTHHDLFLSRHPVLHGLLQGVHPSAQQSTNLLLVSVQRVGAFAFVLDGSELFPDYVGEKLNIRGDTAVALAALLNGIIAAR